MNRLIVRRPHAEADLLEIWSYIADDNESAADRLLGRFETTLMMLAEHPQAGRARHELRPDLRSFPVGRYVVYYSQTSQGIELVRVLSAYIDVDQEDVL